MEGRRPSHQAPQLVKVLPRPKRLHVTLTSKHGASLGQCKELEEWRKREDGLGFGEFWDLELCAYFSPLL